MKFVKQSKLQNFPKHQNCCCNNLERNEVRWRSGKEASLAPPSSNLKSFGSKCTVMKRVLVTLLEFFGNPIVIRRPVNCAPLGPLVTPLVTSYCKFRPCFKNMRISILQAV